MFHPEDLTRRRLLRGLGGLAAALALPAPAAWARRAAPPLVLAQEAPPDVNPDGFLVSEKYDGVRALWDGRQLRFRSGLPVAAPDWFTQRLPAQPLDGELWLGRGRFDALSGAVRRARPDDTEWRQMRYMVFELPEGEGSFTDRCSRIQALAQGVAWAQLQAVEQAPLADRSALQRRLQRVLQDGGEGLVLHRADAPYVTGRTPLLLKLKPVHDAEATVIGHLAGRGKHAGRLGALRVRTDDGVEFHIGTGLSDSEREHPPPLGARITYTHRGNTPGGVPRFASYLRQRTL